MRPEGLVRLARLGIRSDSLAGRLRLVLTIGCYADFRFTRDILSSSGKPEQVEQAINRFGTNTGGGFLAALGRTLGGGSLFITDFTASGNGHVAFAPRFPGKSYQLLNPSH